MTTITRTRKWIKARQAELRAEHVFLFAASFVSECVLSVDTIFTAHGFWAAAGCTTLTFEVLNFVILIAILGDGPKRSASKFTAAALGATAGAMLATYVAA